MVKTPPIVSYVGRQFRHLGEGTTRLARWMIGQGNLAFSTLQSARFPLVSRSFDFLRSKSTTASPVWQRALDLPWFSRRRTPANFPAGTTRSISRRKNEVYRQRFEPDVDSVTETGGDMLPGLPEYESMDTGSFDVIDSYPMINTGLLPPPPDETGRTGRKITPFAGGTPPLSISNEFAARNTRKSSGASRSVIQKSPSARAQETTYPALMKMPVTPPVSGRELPAQPAGNRDNAGEMYHPKTTGTVREIHHLQGDPANIRRQSDASGDAMIPDTVRFKPAVSRETGKLDNRKTESGGSFKEVPVTYLPDPLSGTSRSITPQVSISSASRKPAEGLADMVVNRYRPVDTADSALPSGRKETGMKLPGTARTLPDRLSSGHGDVFSALPIARKPDTGSAYQRLGVSPATVGKTGETAGLVPSAAFGESGFHDGPTGTEMGIENVSPRAETSPPRSGNNLFSSEVEGVPPHAVSSRTAASPEQTEHITSRVDSSGLTAGREARMLQRSALETGRKQSVENQRPGTGGYAGIDMALTSGIIARMLPSRELGLGQGQETSSGVHGSARQSLTRTRSGSQTDSWTGNAGMISEMGHPQLPGSPMELPDSLYTGRFTPELPVVSPVRNQPASAGESLMRFVDTPVPDSPLSRYPAIPELALAPVSGIQRDAVGETSQAGEETAATGSQENEPEDVPGPDIDAIADDVYRILKQRLMTERERALGVY